MSYEPTFEHDIDVLEGLACDMSHKIDTIELEKKDFTDMLDEEAAKLLIREYGGKMKAIETAIKCLKLVDSLKELVNLDPHPGKDKSETPEAFDFDVKVITAEENNSIFWHAKHLKEQLFNESYSEEEAERYLLPEREPEVTEL